MGYVVTRLVKASVVLVLAAAIFITNDVGESPGNPNYASTAKKKRKKSKPASTGRQINKLKKRLAALEQEVEKLNDEDDGSDNDGSDDSWDSDGQQGPTGSQGPQGPQGPQGTQGPRGLQGQNGGAIPAATDDQLGTTAANGKLVTLGSGNDGFDGGLPWSVMPFSPLTPDATGELNPENGTATCPQGTIATGGGAKATSGSLTGSYPAFTTGFPTGWTATVDGGGVRVWVFCTVLRVFPS